MHPARAVVPGVADERSLLLRLEALLARETEAVASPDAAAIIAVAEEREHVAAQLVALARHRAVAGARLSTDDEAELMALYERLRRRHDVQAQVIQRHAVRATRAIGVLAQAAGESPLYRADGRVSMRYGAG